MTVKEHMSSVTSNEAVCFVLFKKQVHEIAALIRLQFKVIFANM